METADCRLRAC